MKFSDNFPVGHEADALNLSIDFDGVIHNADKGFFDGTCYGEPIPGAIEGLKKLAEKYRIVIFTAKAKSDRPLIDGKSGIELVSEWLTKYGLLDLTAEITAEKPRALLYIDDNAYRFSSWDQTLNFVENEFEN
jgi:hypothetical protein